jgi:hypothetical protein
LFLEKKEGFLHYDILGKEIDVKFNSFIWVEEGTEGYEVVSTSSTYSGGALVINKFD